MEGVGGSKNTEEDAETGKVNPEPLSDPEVHLDTGFLTVIGAKTGLLAAELVRGIFSSFTLGRVIKASCTASTSRKKFVLQAASKIICNMTIEFRFLWVVLVLLSFWVVFPL